MNEVNKWVKKGAGQEKADRLPALLGRNRPNPANAGWQLRRDVCVSLPTLLKDVDRADVVHFDIQGSELDVIKGSIDTLNAKMHRLAIGTHGRDLEWQLMRLLDGKGWTLEIDKACAFQQRAASRHHVASGRHTSLAKSPRLIVPSVATYPVANKSC